MNTRDQFGAYLLLKKLAEDALGETFRGGRVGRQTLERVVLLRVLNGAGFDAERIARALQQRAELAKALKSPNVGLAIDVGQVRGVPYIAYDYSAGRSLAQLLEQAARRHSPLPLDHALLVAERVSLALAVAQETRLGDERVQHGFVTPHLVYASNEGELKVLGFEASTGLRESATNPIVRQSVGRYLSPEALAGQPPTRADDVYGVGALLVEMITGQPLPAMPPAGFGAALEQARVAADGSPLPAELAALLQRSLCPREQRLPDIVAWHKALAKWMADSGQSATTFNFAFFLHNLFRDEIERESRELETEKSQAAAIAAAAPARAAEPAAAPSAVRAAGPVREDTSVLREEYGIPKKKSGPSPALLAAVVGGVVVLGVAGYFLFGRGETAPAPAAEVASAPAVEQAAAPVAPAGPTPEEIQNQIAKMIAEQQKQLEAGLAAKYEDQLRALQQQLSDAERARERSAAAAAAQAPAPAPTPVTSAPAPAVEPESEPARAPAPEPAPRPAQETAPAAPAPRPAVTTPAPAAPAPAPAPAPARPAGAVKPGDLVTPGPGVTPPRIVRQATLTYPPMARRIRKEASVSVRVLVDENGDVVQTQIPAGKVGYGFDDAAESYARGSKWDPAKKDGVKVKFWTEIKVEFKL